MNRIKVRLTMKTFQISVFLFALFSSAVFASGSAPSSSTGSAHLIINNINGNSKISVMTNRRTSTSDECSKSDALYATACNSFDLGTNELQSLNSDAAGNLINQIGVHNTDATSYSNKGTENQLHYFTPGKHLFEIDRYRDAADALAARSSGPAAGTYGTISFSQFIDNVANARPMYGIVRVKVPLVKSSSTETDEEDHDDEDDDDHSRDSKSKSKVSFKSSSSKTKSRSTYRLCGEKPTPECSVCGPGIGTDLKPGNKVCGTKLNENSKILVYGSLFFDWVECKGSDTESPVLLEDLPENPRDIYFSISVPVNVNPANVDSAGTMKSLPSIPSIIGNNKCPGASPCNLPVTNTIPFSLVSDESKEQFNYDTKKTLNESLFNTLTKAQQFSLLLPSGYEKGWQEAFTVLGITPSYWQSLTFNAPHIDKEGATSFIDIHEIRSPLFEDIPAYMYTGGLIDMHHHINISGLVYVPQAIEIEQKGLTLGGEKECTKKEKDDDEHHMEKDDEHGDDDKDSMHKSKVSMYSMSTSMDKDDDKHDDDEHKDSTDECSTASKDDDSDHGLDKDKTKHDDDEDDDGHHSDGGSGSGGSTIVFIPSSQYINGAVLVRDSFYIEAKQPGGITVINNDPNTYSNIPLSTDSAIGGKFRPFPATMPEISGGPTGGDSGPGSVPGTSEDKGDDGTGDSGTTDGETTGVITHPGAQWVEIRPQ